MKPGVSLEQARADLDLIYQQGLTQSAGSGMSPQAQQEIRAQKIQLKPGIREARRQISFHLCLSCSRSSGLFCSSPASISPTCCFRAQWDVRERLPCVFPSAPVEDD